MWTNYLSSGPVAICFLGGTTPPASPPMAHWPVSSKSLPPDRKPHRSLSVRHQRNGGYCATGPFAGTRFPGDRSREPNVVGWLRKCPEARAAGPNVPPRKQIATGRESRIFNHHFLIRCVAFAQFAQSRAIQGWVAAGAGRGGTRASRGGSKQENFSQWLKANCAVVRRALPLGTASLPNFAPAATHPCTAIRSTKVHCANTTN